MFRRVTSLTVPLSIALSTCVAWGQPIPVNTAKPVLPQVRPNNFEANQPVAEDNKIVVPVPLSADSQRSALANIDKHVASQVEDLTEKLKTILPDELTILTKTSGWKTEDQQALVGALRAGDRTAVYEAWVKGNPQDTAGAELAARQTDVKSILSRLGQDAEKNKAAMKQNVGEFDAALSKIAGATPAVTDLAAPMKTLKTWVEARKLIDTATPGKGPVAKLPNGGDVTMIMDPTLPVGTAIVLNDQTMLIGNEGGNRTLSIVKGNAAEALGLPIVTGTPLPVLEGEEVLDGVLIINPASTKATINYAISGNQYTAEPGTKQRLARLANNKAWTIDFDRGQNFGSTTYTLAPGSYHFRPTDRGWQLFRLKFEVTLDNALNNQEFNFIFQGDDLAIPAGGARTLVSDYPVVVKFDRGNGSNFVSKATPLTIGNLQIGVNATDNMWDLFPTNENRREVSKLKPFNVDGQRKP
jgi:flagellar biosynthesis/type III secretory pathway chaperone